mgnify:CR=1 FL=1
MLKNKSDCCAILENFQKEAKVVGTALVGSKGSLILHTLQESFDSETMGAIVSTMVNLAKEAIQGFKQSNLEQILVKGRSEFIIFKMLNNKMVLVVMFEKVMKLNSASKKIDEVANKINEMLGKDNNC